MPVTVTITTAPAQPVPGPVEYGYLEVNGPDYETARDEGLAGIPDGRRAIAIRAGRT